MCSLGGNESESEVLMLVSIELNCDYTGAHLENRASYGGHTAAIETGLLQGAFLLRQLAFISWKP